MAFTSAFWLAYADVFSPYSRGLQGYTSTQQEANNIAFSHNLHQEKDIREQENENITRMWDRLSRPSPILTKVLIWVFLGVSVSDIFLLMVSR